MREVVVKETQANKRIDKYLKEVFPRLPLSALYKALRKKDIKVNGVRVKEEYIVKPGDKLEVYIIDQILDGIHEHNDNFKLNQSFSVIYEDSNVLLVNKQQGIPVHPDREQSSGTLIDLVKEYLKQKGEYYPSKPSSFPPSLCHRLDRNTGGIVIIAKNEESLRILLDKIKNKEIKKYYQCLVKGRMESNSSELKAYLKKDENKSRVYISNEKKNGYVEIITRYKLLSYDAINDISRLEVELVTGRTHQIRAHLAHIGHPIIGDGKYGTNAINRTYGAKYQSLWAYKVVFDFNNAGILNYLKGKAFEVQPDFKQYKKRI